MHNVGKQPDNDLYRAVLGTFGGRETRQEELSQRDWGRSTLAFRLCSGSSSVQRLICPFEADKPVLDILYAPQ